MKKLSDHKGDEAIILWADMLDPMIAILNDEKVKKAITSGKSKIEIAKEILKKHSKEAAQILLLIDPTPLDGLNLILRLVALLSDIEQNEEIASFFGFAEQAKQAGESIGSPTENIGE